MSIKQLPSLIKVICANCDAWIVGGAAVDLANAKDIDVMVPIRKWHRAAAYIPEGARVNSFGGWRFTFEGVEIDIWPDTLDRLASYQVFRAAWHPKSGKRIVVTAGE